VIAADGTIYVCSGTKYSIQVNYLYAINPNLTLKWKSISLGIYKNNINIAIAKNGIVWVSGSDNNGKLLTFDPNPTGTTDVEPLGTYTTNTSGDLWSNLSIGKNGTIYFYCDKLYAFDPNQYTGSLQPIWSSPIIKSRGLWINMAIDNQGVIYVASILDIGTYLYAYSPNQSFGDFNVTPSWFSVNINSGASFSVNANMVVVGNNGTIYISFTNKIYAFDPNQTTTDVTPKWSYNNLSNIIGIAFNETLYVVDYDEGLWTIDTNGNATNISPLSGLNTVPCIGQDGTVYVGRSTDSSVYAISQNGAATVLSSFTGEYFTDASLTGKGFSIGSDGTLYVPSDDPYGVVQPYLAAIKD
jgi:hypothetical protein